MNFQLFLVLQLSLILLFIISWWVCLYPSTMASLHCHCRQLFFLVNWSSFPHCPWALPIGCIAAYTPKTFLSDHIVAIHSPWNPASGLVLCSSDDAVDGKQSWFGTAPLPPLLSAGVPPVKKWPGWIIRRRHADRSRKRECPWYLV